MHSQCMPTYLRDKTLVTSPFGSGSLASSPASSFFSPSFTSTPPLTSSITSCASPSTASTLEPRRLPRSPSSNRLTYPSGVSPSLGFGGLCVFFGSGGRPVLTLFPRDRLPRPAGLVEPSAVNGRPALEPGGAKLAEPPKLPPSEKLKRRFGSVKARIRPPTEPPWSGGARVDELTLEALPERSRFCTFDGDVAAELGDGPVGRTLDALPVDPDPPPKKPPMPAPTLRPLRRELVGRACDDERFWSKSAPNSLTSPGPPAVDKPGDVEGVPAPVVPFVAALELRLMFWLDAVPPPKRLPSEPKTLDLPPTLAAPVELSAVVGRDAPTFCCACAK